MQSRPSRWPWLIVVVVVVGAGWWLFRQNMPQDTPAEETPASAASPAAPASSTAPAQQTPQIQHPIADAVADDAETADAAAPALPALGDSDGGAWDALAQAAGTAPGLDLLLRDRLIPRLVVMIDNLTLPSLSQRAMAIKPVPGKLAVEQADTATTIAASNAQRYAPYVQAFTQADPTTLVRAYKRFYPLFQQAYVDLGYTNGYFNDRLVAVIDHLLQAPEPAQPPALELDAKGRYRYVDPVLEGLSVGQKALVRLGPEQERAVKVQLKAMRAALTRM